MTTRTAAVTMAVICVCLGVLSCAPGALPIQAPSSSSAGTGSAVVRVKWPQAEASTRVIPEETRSITLDLTLVETGEVLDYLHTVIEREPGASDATATITGIPATEIRFEATAWSEADGSGSVLAEGSATETITPEVTPGSDPTAVGIVLTATTGPPGSARIAFISNRDGNDEIYVMAEDGSNQRNVTQHPGRDVAPCFAPDGQHIAFSSNREGTFDIHTLDLATGEVTRITNSGANDNSPDWSPDGTRIAFQRGNNYSQNIVIRDIATGVETTLPKTGAYAWTPVWSPDGTQIAYMDPQGSSHWNRAVYVYDLASGSRTRITSGGREYPFDWGALGTILCYRENVTMFLVDPVTKAQTTLGGLASSGVRGALSPSEDRVVFSGQSSECDIHVMDIATEVSTQLTSAPGQDWDPDWYTES